MKVRVIKIGRIAYPEIRTLAAVYQERLPPLANLANVDSIEAKDETGLARYLLKPASEHPLVVLDERGQELSSRELASKIQGWTDNPAVKSLTFLIGGPMGLSEELRHSAAFKLSLSRATFTSDLAWLLLWEQLYRAYNITRGTNYHHD